MPVSRVAGVDRIRKDRKSASLSRRAGGASRLHLERATSKEGEPRSTKKQKQLERKEDSTYRTSSTVIERSPPTPDVEQGTEEHEVEDGAVGREEPVGAAGARIVARMMRISSSPSRWACRGGVSYGLR